MKLRYMIEYALRDRIRDPRYEPVGVWVQGPAWWKTASGLCPRIFWPTIRPRSLLTAACAALSSKPTNIPQWRPARRPFSFH